MQRSGSYSLNSVDTDMTPDGGRRLIVEMIRNAKATGTIRPIDVAQINSSLLEGRAISRDEADALFDLDRADVKKCPEWTACFVQAVSEHLVWQCRPTGILSAEQGEWLLGRFDDSPSVSALATLVNVLAEAERVPMWFLASVRGRLARNAPPTLSVALVV